MTIPLFGCFFDSSVSTPPKGALTLSEAITVQPPGEDPRSITGSVKLSVKDLPVYPACKNLYLSSNMESLKAAREGSPSSCALRTYGSVSCRRSQFVELKSDDNYNIVI